MFKLKIKSVFYKPQRGFSLFIAILTSGTLLIVGAALSNIIVRQLQSTYTGRESQYAFFAADAGIECALYWDTKVEPSMFATSSSGNLPISCAGHSVSTGDAVPGTSTLARIGGGGNANRTSTFGFIMNNGANPVSHCAVVTVTKNIDGTTYIKSRGYNTCIISNPKRVERGVEVTY